FWYTIKKVKDSESYEFLLANKKCIVDAEVFRKILDNSLRVKGKESAEVQDGDATVTFLIDLGYKGPLHKRVVKKKVIIFVSENIIPDPDVAMELAADAMQALKESKKTSRRQPCTEGSSEGTGRIPRVPDESTVVSATLSKGTGTKSGVPDEENVTLEANVILKWGSEQESEYSKED
nr:hypothetical protein [Tanacetum cinerariifolium]